MPSPFINLSPVYSISISECIREKKFTIKKKKLTGITRSYKNKGTIGQMGCWQKDRDPLKA
jgi:hypothetical protein